MAGGARLRDDRDGGFLAEGPAGPARRAAPGGDRHRSVLPAVRPWRPRRKARVTNTSRLVQWHDKVCEPPGDSRSDLWFVYHLGTRLKELYADSTEPRDAAIQALTWDYPVSGAMQEPDAAAVLREINGYTVADRQAADELPGAEGRRQHGRAAAGCTAAFSRPTHDNTLALAQAGRAGRPGQPPRLGVRLARQPPHPLQSRLRRSRTASRGPSARR